MLTSQIRKPLYFLVKRTLGIVKVSCLLLTVSVLLSACSTTQPDEPKWNDMYEVRTYDVHTETITNEIITTVFICRQTETNKVISVAKEAEDFGGYEFEPIGEDINVPTTPVVKQNLTTPEFQCVDGSCGLGGDINVPSK